MGVAGSPKHFLVEWYRPALADEPFDTSVERLIECAESMAATDSPVRLRATFSTPADEVVLALFDSASAEAVVEVCCQAGCPAQRLTAHVDARFWPPET